MLQRSLLSTAILLALSPALYAQHEQHAPADSTTADARPSCEVEELVVTGVRTSTPLQLITDPKRPRQPLPAHDGADYLKTIPGFSVVRKGGSDGDPILRGMAGSRISMLVDGELILGGCNNRMDPPTAYVFPETFDSIRVIKGPQSVQYGPGNSAGVVLFERSTQPVTESGWKLHSSVLAASYGRHDEVLDARYLSPQWELRASGSNSSADNFRDGDGTSIHSRYQRWNSQLSLAWKPDEHSRLEAGASFSDGEAAYADRGVDGSKFARANYSLKYSREHISPLLQRIEVQTYHNYVDHVMDNYSMRQPDGMMAQPMAMNPDRSTSGAKLAFRLTPAPVLELDLGLDLQRNSHTSRTSMHQLTQPYSTLPRSDDAEFKQLGLFLEAERSLANGGRVVAGLRADHWQYQDQRSSIALSMMSNVANPLAGHKRDELLRSGFLRYEGLLGESSTWYAGLGHNERFPDYWEITKETATALSASDSLQAERNTQFDTGLILRGERFETSISLFYSAVSDYLMIQSNVMKPAVGAGMNGMHGMGTGDMDLRSATIARNIEARSWGIEVDGQYRFADNWRAEFSLASVRGANDTDNRTLAQLPPLEARLGFYYDNSRWSAGLLWRALARQDRVDLHKGNIVGQDFGPTPSADILSLNGGWRLTPAVLLTAGIDNLLDTTYAEHVSRAGALIPGFEQVRRVNEPGRTLWMKAQYSF
jgi:iron complex outermembrane receptor protein